MPIDLLAAPQQQGGPVDLLAGMEPQQAQQPQLEPTEPAPEYGQDVRQQALATIGEFAASANRSVADFVDFIGPDTVNAILRMAGQEFQVPTVRGSLKNTGIEGGFMEPGMARDAVQGAGEALTYAGGFKPVTRAAGTLKSAAADMLGLGFTKEAAPVAATAAAAGGMPSVIDRITGKGKEVAELPLKRGTGDVSTALYKLDRPGAGAKVTDDYKAKAAIKQGFDEGFVAMIKASPAKAREKMTAMLDVVDQGKKNFRAGAENRPLDIAGDSVVMRVDVVKAANRAAGNRLDHVAKSLKGKPINVAPAVDSFLEKIKEMGVSLNIKENAISFIDSDLEGVIGPQRVLKNVINRMRNTKAPDAYDIHRLKKFLDEQVTYGKNARGLGGKTEGILKSLRHNLDGLLDEQFPEYNRVNTEYSETIGALDALQDVAGRKMDFYGPNADKAIGTLTRRLLSNAQSRIPLKDAIAQLDAVAKKFTTDGAQDIVPHGYISKRSGVKASDLDDDVMGQVLFVDELEKLTGAFARTSFQGDIEKVVRRTANADGRGMIADAVEAGVNKARGINEDNALKAMRALLKD